MIYSILLTYNYALSNFLLKNQLQTIILLLLLTSLFLFLKARTIFFKLVFLLFTVTTLCFLLVLHNADFFAGFLLVAELPIILIGMLFYFHKYSLQVDTVYAFKQQVLRLNFVYVLLSILIGVLFNAIFNSYLKPAVIAGATGFSTFYQYVFFSTAVVSSRNDFFLYYVVYYIFYYNFTLVLGLLLFIVSLICILLFFTFKKINDVRGVTKLNTLFLRKQSMTRQASFNSKLKFFKKTKKQ